MVRIVAILFVAVVLLFNNATAQLTTVRGVVLDDKGKGIPFANIYVDNLEHQGTSSNVDGKFLLNLNNTNFDKYLIISSIGYKTIRVNLKDIKYNEINKFKLENDNEVLNEVVIKPINIYDTVFKAVSLISVNHPRFNYEAFYRSYLKQNKKWVRFIEASINVTNFNLQNLSKRGAKNDKYSVCINNIRLSYDKSDKNTKIKTNPYFILDKIGTINLNKYNLRLENILIENDNSIYVVKFVPKKKKNKYTGTLYIDAKTLGFLKISYFITDDYKNRMKRKKRWGKLEGKFIRYNYFYKFWHMDIYFTKSKDIFRLDKIINKTYSINELVKEKKRLFTYEVFEEIYFNKRITQIQCQKFKIFRNNDIFKLKNLPVAMPSFWETYNYSIHDSIQKNAIKILKQ